MPEICLKSVDVNSRNPSSKGSYICDVKHSSGIIRYPVTWTGIKWDMHKYPVLAWYEEKRMFSEEEIKQSYYEGHSNTRVHHKNGIYLKEILADWFNRTFPIK